MDKSHAAAAGARGGHSGFDRAWGPTRWARVAPALGCVAAAVWWVLDTRSEDRVVAGVLVVMGLVLAILVARIGVRLRASVDGVTVIGPLHRNDITWERIAQISTPRRGRFGRAGATLELEVWPEGADVPDTELMTFGSFELGTDPADVGRTLLRLRAGAQ